jgi:hypothetical protein
MSSILSFSRGSLVLVVGKYRHAVLRRAL